MFLTWDRVIAVYLLDLEASFVILLLAFLLSLDGDINVHLVCHVVRI